jgi:ATP-dependent protease ClpP protease subunit
MKAKLDLPTLLARATALRESRDRPMPGSGHYAVRAAGGGTVGDVYLYGAIGGWVGKSAQDVVDEITALNVSKLRVHINSPGGDVFEGLAIYNTLTQFDGEVETLIEGRAFSIASIIALAGDPVTMFPASLYLIHDPHAVAFGRAAEMRSVATLLDQAAMVLADVYVARTKRPVAQIRTWMAEEKSFRPDEALAMGFVDNVPGPDAQPDPMPEPEPEPEPEPAPPAPVPPPEPEPATARARRRELAARLVAANEYLVAL